LSRFRKKANTDNKLLLSGETKESVRDIMERILDGGGPARRMVNQNALELGCESKAKNYLVDIVIIAKKG